MFKIFQLPYFFLTRHSTNKCFKRLFLSNSYKCTEAWENRLKNPIFQKINLEAMCFRLDKAFSNNEIVSLLDVDLIANMTTNYNYKNEIEDIILKLRLCPESSLLPERTTHAAIRWYIDNAPKEDILNVLSDRINYGLFPDYYLTNILMDKYINNKDAVSAVKIAVLQMLQEEFENPITKVLALYCCYNYLGSEEIWESLREPEPDPDEEVKKVRVDFLRNPYFDDHFDITDTNHLVGKTLLLFGESLGGPIGMSSQLIGLVLYEKYNKCASLVNNIIKNNIPLYAEAVLKAKEYIQTKPKQAVESEANEEKNEADVSIKEKTEGEMKLDSSSNEKLEVLELLEKIDKKNLIEGNLFLEVENLVKNVVNENENKDIEFQCQIYKQWEKEREDHIQFEVKKSEVKKVESEIMKTKEELEKEEEKLFFFDKEEEYEMIAQKKEEEMKSVVFYKGKRKMREKTEEDYIPPVVQPKKLS